jgi:hypothetical protein
MTSSKPNPLDTVDKLKEGKELARLIAGHRCFSPKFFATKTLQELRQSSPLFSRLYSKRASKGPPLSLLF